MRRQHGEDRMSDNSAYFLFGSQWYTPIEHATDGDSHGVPVAHGLYRGRMALI